jgi:hypothetical protein
VNRPECPFCGYGLTPLLLCPHGHTWPIELTPAVLAALHAATCRDMPAGPRAPDNDAR